MNGVDFRSIQLDTCGNFRAKFVWNRLMLDRLWSASILGLWINGWKRVFSLLNDDYHVIPLVWHDS